MMKKIKLLLCKISITSFIMIMSFAFTETAYAYSYGTNLLKNSSNTTGGGYSLNNTETVQLSPEDIERANKGDLYYNAYAHIGANGSRQVTRNITVQCKNSGGSVISSGTYSDGGSTYWVAHADYKYNSGNIRIPEGTTQITYSASVSIGTWGSLELWEMYLKLYDDGKPAYSSVSPVTAAGTYPSGTTIRYGVNFNEAIGSVTNPGTFTTNFGTATYAGLSTNRHTLYYDYTIPSSGTVSNYIPVKMNSISNLVVKDDAGNTSDTVNKSSLTDNYGIYTDNKYPSVSSFITEASANSYFVSGEEIVFNATFDENIKVSGSPYISLSNGKKAIYKSRTQSDSNLASFVYTVGSSDSNTNQLKITGIDFTGIVDKVNQSATSASAYNKNMYNEFLNNYNMGIDTNVPTVGFTDPTDIYHNENYKVFISPTDNLSGIKLLYSDWILASSGKAPEYRNENVNNVSYEVMNPSSSGAYNLWIKAVDKAGNISSTKSPYTYKFDVTPPTVIITPSYISGYSAVSSIDISINDDVSIAAKKYLWKDSVGTTVAQGDINGEITYPDTDGIYSLTVTAADSVSHTTVQTKENISIDKTGPAVIFTPNGNNTWAKSNTVSISVSDEKTGVKSYQYAWSDSVETPTSDWTVTTDTSFTTPSDKSGTYYLHIRSIDNAGNETDKVSGGFNIDNKPPTVEISPNGNLDNLGQSEYEIGITVQDAITANSKLNLSYAFSQSEVTSELAFLPLSDETLKLSNFNKTTYLYVKAIDEAGNTTLFKSKAFIADTAAPTGSITKAAGEFINKASINLNFTANDDCISQNDIKMQLTIDGTDGEWEFFTSSKTVTFGVTEGNHTILVKFKDKNGNVSTSYSTSFIYDITPPVINIAYVPDGPTNGSVIATATTLDIIDGEKSHTFTENGSFTFYAHDEAGNTSLKNAEVNWIDKTNPIIGFSSNEFDNKKHRSAKIKINCEDNANGISSIKYRIVQVVKDGNKAGEWQACTNGSDILLNDVSDGNYYIEATAKDGVGNETNKSSGYIYIDVTKPVATIKYSPQTRTANNVEAVISFNETVTITNNNGSNTYLFADNGDFTFEFVDEAGNSSTETASVTWIDRDKPQARIAITDESFKTVSQDKWVNCDLLVTIAPPAQSTIDNLTFNGNSVTTGSSISSDVVVCENNTYLVRTYGVFKYVVHDTDTFLESDGEITVRIDKNAPEFVSEIRTTTDWTNKDVVVTITASDDLSNVTYTSGNSYTFTENGSHTFNFTDAAGNKNSYTATVTNIDKDVPASNISYTSDGASYNGEFTNKDITVHLDLDSLSPVKITNNGGSDTYTFTSNSEFTFEFINEAGNSGSKKVVIDKIDKSAPTAYVTYSETTWTNKDVIATLHVSDEWSGAENDGETYTFIANGEHQFTARDRAGNTFTTTASAIRIDKIPPTLSYSVSPLGKTPFSVFATVTADESVTWLNNGGRNSMQFKSNGSFVFKAQDYAGNISEIAVDVANITKESTPVKLEYSTTKPTSQDVYVTLYPEDRKNDVVFVINNDNSKIYKFSENGEFSFNYRNPAGIEGDAVASVTNINKTPPVVTVQYSTTELTKEDVVATLTADKEVKYPFAALNGKYTFSKNDKVKIPVTDMVGNVTNVLLEVNWIDKDAPKIVLDNQYEAISKGTKFNENNGVSVTDANAVPKGLIITGKVDTSYVGDYEIKYCATDIAGNTGEITKHVTVYDPDGFNVIINGRMPVNSEVEISGSTMKLETINQIGSLKLLCASGKKSFGYFKKNGDEITKEYTFENKGFYTLYMQDENRNSKLVYIFVK